ncbi:hypothetical protein [Halorussus pelagicus]|uniref:hypothetical protein n=1 Tax=Halorussus pelagicus TaxID=2505977 RepID=UPI000FFB95F6|nr:hypothetical protein [Halorussus pelagicus]
MKYKIRETLFGRSRTVSRNHASLAAILFIGIVAIFELAPNLKFQQWFAYILFGIMGFTALINAYRNSGVVISIILAGSIPLGAFTLAAVTKQPPTDVLLSEFVRALFLGIIIALPAHLVGAGLGYVSG